MFWKIQNTADQGYTFNQPEKGITALHTLNTLIQKLQQEHNKIAKEKSKAEGRKLQEASRALLELKKQLKKERREEEQLALAEQINTYQRELSTKPSDSEDKSKTNNTEEGKEFESEHERESKTKDCEELKDYKTDPNLASEETKLEKNDAKFECSETQLDLDECAEKIKGDDIQHFDNTDSDTAKVVEDIFKEEELGNENNKDKENDTFSIEDDIKIESKESTENDLEEKKEP